MLKHEIQKAKGQIELNFSRDIKENKILSKLLTKGRTLIFRPKP